MADAHEEHEEHEDHGNTPAAWFLTLSWIVAWSVAGVAIVLGGDLVAWTGIALAASVACALVAGVMKKAGLGRKEDRPTPPTREAWDAARRAAAAPVEPAVDAEAPALVVDEPAADVAEPSVAVKEPAADAGEEEPAAATAK